MIDKYSKIPIDMFCNRQSYYEIICEALHESGEISYGEWRWEVFRGDQKKFRIFRNAVKILMEKGWVKCEKGKFYVVEDRELREKYYKNEEKVIEEDKELLKRLAK